ncbi:hypothetical protein GOP47_0027966, partial [Adiantum capillus-veneris]
MHTHQYQPFLEMEAEAAYFNHHHSNIKEMAILSKILMQAQGSACSPVDAGGIGCTYNVVEPEAANNGRNVLYFDAMNGDFHIAENSTASLSSTPTYSSSPLLSPLSHHQIQHDVQNCTSFAGYGNAACLFDKAAGNDDLSFLLGDQQQPSPTTAQKDVSATMKELATPPCSEEEVNNETSIGHHNSTSTWREAKYAQAALQVMDWAGIVMSAANSRPQRRHVRLSSHPQTASARRRRERISLRIRVLQQLVPGGTHLDTASMLDEAIRYLKFLKAQLNHLQSLQATRASHSSLT